MLQREELQLQREELVLTRRELEKSADAQQKSQEALNRQAESLLLAAYLDSLTSLRACYEDGEMRSRGFANGEFTLTPPQQARMFTRLETIVQSLEGKLPVAAANSTHGADDFALQYDKERAIQAVREQHAKLSSVTQYNENEPEWAQRVKEAMRQAEVTIRTVCAPPTQALSSALNTGHLTMACPILRQGLGISIPSADANDFRETCNSLFISATHAKNIIAGWLGSVGARR